MKGIIGSGIDMKRLTDMLSALTGRTVLDQTGYTGSFNVHLEWTPDQSTPGPGGLAQFAPPVDTGGPSIFTALQEQLGLKLESKKAPVEILVIDHAEKPSEN